jgi:hypothetical protein
MADQSGSAHLQALFESALQVYERKTGVTLAQHPLAVQLESCHSVGDVTTLLQGKAQPFSGHRASNNIMKSIKSIVSSLTPLSEAVTLSEALGPVRQNVLMPLYL